MKKFVWCLALLIAVISVSAYIPAPDSVFIYRNSKCYSDGSFAVNLTHTGRNIAFKDINISAESDTIGPVLVIGQWLRGKFPAANDTGIDQNNTGVDFVSSSSLTFKTTNNIFTQGHYVITVTWPSNTLYYQKMDFAIDCPGRTCSSDSECVSQQSCVNNLCQWVECSEDRFASGHVCIPKCNDGNSCTNDYYINGQCVHVKIPGCCSSDSDCSNQLSCVGSQCAKSQSNNIFVIMWNWLKSLYQ